MSSLTFNDLILMRLDMLDRRVEMIERNIFNPQAQQAQQAQQRLHNTYSMNTMQPSNVNTIDDIILDRIVCIMDKLKCQDPPQPQPQPQSPTQDKSANEPKREILKESRRRTTIAG